MVPYLGDFAEDATIYIYFNTFSSDDPSASVTVTNLADSDIHVYKDGSETFIVTDGATVIVNHDTGDLGDGVHLLTIDTSADAAYSTGSDYAVRVEGITIDGGTINSVVGVFSIENRFNAAVTDGATLAAGAITDASLAGNMEIVFETDFATNYNTSRDAWVTNGTDFIGTGWNVGKTGYALTTADWNVGKTGYTLTATTGLGAQTANITGNLSGSVGSVTGAVGSVAGNVDGSVGSNLELGPSEVNAEVDTALADINLDHFVGTASGIPALPAGTYLDLLQDDGTATYSRATDSLQAIRDHATTIKSDTAAIGTAGAGLTDLGGMSTGMKAEVLVEVLKLFVTQMTEAYASDGTAPTLAQALFLIQQVVQEFAISGTTITVKKLDGSTTAATYTLDDGTSPTSRTRAT